MPEPLFDDQLRALRRARALHREPRPFLAERVVEDLAERLAVVQREFGTALVTGCPPALQDRLSSLAREVLFATSLDGLARIEETSIDLLLVLGELDSRDELPLLLRIIRSRLSDDALFAGAFPGGQSLPALRHALHAADAPSGNFPMRLHPRIEPAAFAGLLSEAGFVEPIVDIDRVTLRYRSLARLLADLRDHGATNLLRQRYRKPLGKAGLRAASAAFTAAAEDGAMTERIELINFAAWTAAPRIRA